MPATLPLNFVMEQYNSTIGEKHINLNVILVNDEVLNDFFVISLYGDLLIITFSCLDFYLPLVCSICFLF